MRAGPWWEGAGRGCMAGDGSSSLYRRARPSITQWSTRRPPATACPLRPPDYTASAPSRPGRSGTTHGADPLLHTLSRTRSFLRPVYHILSSYVYFIIIRSLCNILFSAYTSSFHLYTLHTSARKSYPSLFLFLQNHQNVIMFNPFILCMHTQVPHSPVARTSDSLTSVFSRMTGKYLVFLCPTIHLRFPFL